MWNIEDKVKISYLNGNLVVRFADYVTGEIFYSIVGKVKTEATVKSLLEYSDAEGYGAFLK